MFEPSTNEPVVPLDKHQGGKLKRLASRTDSGLWSANKMMVYVAAVGLFLMMMITVVDVIGRYVFNKPLLGAYELVGFTLAIAGPWAMGYAQLKKGMVRVDFLLQRFSKRGQVIITGLAHLIGLVVYGLLTWRMILLAEYFLNLKRGNTTDTMGIPIFPFVVIVAIGCGMLAVVLIFDLVHSLSEVKRK